MPVAGQQQNASSLSSGSSQSWKEYDFSSLTQGFFTKHWTWKRVFGPSIAHYTVIHRNSSYSSSFLLYLGVVNYCRGTTWAWRCVRVIIWLKIVIFFTSIFCILLYVLLKYWSVDHEEKTKRISVIYVEYCLFYSWCALNTFGTDWIFNHSSTNIWDCDLFFLLSFKKLKDLVF